MTIVHAVGRILSIVLVFVLLAIAGLIGYVEIKKWSDARQVTAWLIRDQGYAKDDLLKVRGKFGKLPTFSVGVVFRDEPHVEYWYRLDGDHGIKALGPEISAEARKQGMKLPEDYPFRHLER